MGQLLQPGQTSTVVLHLSNDVLERTVRRKYLRVVVFVELFVGFIYLSLTAGHWCCAFCEPLIDVMSGLANSCIVSVEDGDYPLKMQPVDYLVCILFINGQQTINTIRILRTVARLQPCAPYRFRLFGVSSM
uniref:Ion_trans domain-containing protein n=1 Tax=Ascaris lumbricoides TaxID=6252 RepID=A0A0M3HNS5_ASCLU